MFVLHAKSYDSVYHEADCFLIMEKSADGYKWKLYDEFIDVKSECTDEEYESRYYKKFISWCKVSSTAKDRDIAIKLIKNAVDSGKLEFDEIYDNGPFEIDLIDLSDATQSKSRSTLVGGKGAIAKMAESWQKRNTDNKANTI